MTCLRVPLCFVSAALFAACTVNAAAASEKAFALDIAGGKVDAAQRVIKVEKGDAVRVRVTSDAPGELHLHGYRLELKMVAGTPAEFAFTAFATGRYPFEWHGAAAANAALHRGPPLATIEVRPK